jgi:uncharacterized phage protein (TIGR01671 family)
MREIKFRAWDKDNKIWLDFFAVKENGKLVIPVGNLHFKEIKNVDVVQYTGLKDKNGKEVYEGDVLESKNEGVGQVHYDDFCGCWALQFDDEDNAEELLGNALKDYKLEVIGNVYENWELVEMPYENS